MAVFNFSNVAPPTTLDGGITDVAVTLDVNSGASYPGVPFKIRIGAEVISVGAKASDTFSTLVRGVDATANVAHSDTDPVEHVVTAEDIMPRYDAAADNYHMTKDLDFNANDIIDVGEIEVDTVKPTSGSQLILEDDIGNGRVVIGLNSIGDILFRKKDGGTASLLWDESDDQWEFLTGATFAGQVRFTNAIVPVIFGAAGDTQLMLEEGTNDWRFEMGNNANSFTRRMMFTSSDHASPHDISFHDGTNDAIVTFLWNDDDGIWYFDTDLSMNVNSKIIDVEDPTAGNHVGDRDYNDARYVLQ